MGNNKSATPAREKKNTKDADPPSAPATPPPKAPEPQQTIVAPAGENAQDEELVKTDMFGVCSGYMRGGQGANSQFSAVFSTEIGAYSRRIGLYGSTHDKLTAHGGFWNMTKVMSVDQIRRAYARKKKIELKEGEGDENESPTGEEAAKKEKKETEEEMSARFMLEAIEESDRTQREKKLLRETVEGFKAYREAAVKIQHPNVRLLAEVLGVQNDVTFPRALQCLNDRAKAVAEREKATKSDEKARQAALKDLEEEDRSLDTLLSDAQGKIPELRSAAVQCRKEKERATAQLVKLRRSDPLDETNETADAKSALRVATIKLIEAEEAVERQNDLLKELQGRKASVQKDLEKMRGETGPKSAAKNKGKKRAHEDDGQPEGGDESGKKEKGSKKKKTA